MAFRGPAASVVCTFGFGAVWHVNYVQAAIRSCMLLLCLSVSFTLSLTEQMQGIARGWYSYWASALQAKRTARILAGCHDNPLALAAKASWPKLMLRVVSGINWQLVCRVRSVTRSWCRSYEYTYMYHNTTCTWMDGRALRRSPTDRLKEFKFELGSHGSTMESSTFVAFGRRRLYIAMFISRTSTSMGFTFGSISYNWGMPRQ